jgi:hypothetical protein
VQVVTHAASLAELPLTQLPTTLAPTSGAAIDMVLCATHSVVARVAAPAVGGVALGGSNGTVRGGVGVRHGASTQSEALLCKLFAFLGDYVFYQVRVNT